jgi:SAM-dependent methyltransferase
MVKLAREKLQQSGFAVCDAKNLPFKASNFDTVIGSEIIYYLHDPHSFLRNVFRVLVPGGQLILLWGNPTFNFVYRLASLVGLRPTDPLGLRTPTRLQMLKMLTSAFPARRIEFYGVGLPLGISKVKANVVLALSPVNAVVVQVR